MKNNHLEYIDGEVYEILEVAGHKFEIRCGYHTTLDEKAGVALPIYPDFILEPKYTNTGQPLVTCMQNSCIYYDVVPESDIELKCIDCKYFINEDRKAIGICTCEERKKK